MCVYILYYTAQSTFSSPLHNKATLSLYQLSLFLLMPDTTLSFLYYFVSSIIVLQHCLHVLFWQPPLHSNRSVFFSSPSYFLHGEASFHKKKTKHLLCNWLVSQIEQWQYRVWEGLTKWRTTPLMLAPRKNTPIMLCEVVGLWRGIHQYKPFQNWDIGTWLDSPTWLTLLNCPTHAHMESQCRIMMVFSCSKL